MNTSDSKNYLKDTFTLFKNNGIFLRNILDKGERIHGHDLNLLQKTLHMNYRDILILLYSHGLYVEDWEDIDKELAKLEEKDRQEMRRKWQ